MKKVKKPVKDFSREKRRHHQAKNIEMLNQFIYDERKYFFAEMCRLSKEKSVVPPKKLFYEWWSSRASITERSFLGQSHQKMPFRKICLEYELAHNQSFVSFLVSGDQIYTWMPVEKRVDSSEVLGDRGSIIYVTGLLDVRVTREVKRFGAISKQQEGTHLDESVEMLIEACNAVVAIINDLHECEYEISLASNLGKPVLLVLAPDSELTVKVVLDYFDLADDDHVTVVNYEEDVFPSHLVRHFTRFP